MRKDGFTVCANNYINCLRQEGRYATAHVYENVFFFKQKTAYEVGQ